MDSINLNDSDLAANRQETVSPGQRNQLRRQRLVWIGGTAGILLILVGVTAVFILKAINPAFAGRGQLFILLPLAAFWLWLLRNSPVQWQRTNRDLREGRAAAITGQVSADFNMGIGLFRTLRYEIAIDDIRFRVDGGVFHQFKTGETYRIYYSPNAKIFLGAVALVQDVENTAGKEESAVSPTLLDPLTEREAEILHLIAAGLSNKEIAAQLSLSTNTVKMYASQLYQKLGVGRRTEAVARAREIGLLEE
ncbi:MAG: response regulator transcription factor [Candidatus Promineifilaceae bacterium]